LDYNKIEEIRKRLKLNQAEIAAKMGISRGGLQKMIYSENISVKNLEKLSEILGVNPAYWWKEKEASEFTAQDVPSVYEIDLRSEINRLRKQHEKDQKTIDNLNDHIEELKEKLKGAGAKERKDD
jgi:transcriptional regulator with XRE-family HTH domain